MSRPGKPLTKKSIQLQSKMAELEKADKYPGGLLANVLDMEDGCIAGSILEEDPLGLQAGNLMLGISSQPRNNLLDVEQNRWTFPAKVNIQDEVSC